MNSRKMITKINIILIILILTVFFLIYHLSIQKDEKVKSNIFATEKVTMK